MFASTSLSRHFAKGLLGITLMVIATYFSTVNGLISIAAIIAAAFAFRGCPVCWGVGLVETLRMKRCSDHSKCGAGGGT